MVITTRQRISGLDKAYGNQYWMDRSGINLGRVYRKRPHAGGRISARRRDTCRLDQMTGQMDCGPASIRTGFIRKPTGMGQDYSCDSTGSCIDISNPNLPVIPIDTTPPLVTPPGTNWGNVFASVLPGVFSTGEKIALQQTLPSGYYYNRNADGSMSIVSTGGAQAPVSSAIGGSGLLIGGILIMGVLLVAGGKK